MSEPQCYFGVQLDTQCYKLEFWQTTGTVKLTGLFGHEGELTICFHHQQLFGNVFERRAKYCCGVLGSHQHRVQSKKQISLLMAKELKAKGYKVIPGNSLCRQFVKKI